MLVLARKAGEDILIDGGIRITVISVHGSICKIGIEAPKDIKVYRAEVLEKIRREGPRDHRDEVLEVQLGSEGD